MAKEPRNQPDLDQIPKPFEYNPSSWSQRVRIAAIASIAFFIAVYMGLYQWGLIDSAWDPVFGEQTENVLMSDVSHRMSTWFRIPDSIFGSIAYLGDIIFALAGSTRRWQYRPWLVVVFGIDVIPLGIVSAILVVMQGAVVHNWCFLCLVTAAISLVLVALAYDEVWSCMLYLWRLWKRAPSQREFWSAFFGRPSELAHEVGESVLQDRSKR